VQFTATAKDANGAAISGKTFTWNSSAAGVASISASGLATAVANGSSTITASTDGVDGTAKLVVALAPTGATIQGTVSLTNTAAIREAVRLAQRRAGSAGARAPAARLAAGRAPAGVAKAGSRPKAALGAVGLAKHLRQPAVPGEWIVTFRPEVLGLPKIGSLEYRGQSTTAQAVSSIRTSLAASVAAGHIKVAGVSPVILSARVVVPPGHSAAAVGNELRANPAVLAVEPNYRRYVTGQAVARVTPVVPNDPLYPYQAWHYGMADVPRAWATTTGSASVLVAVVDNGVRFDHPDIAPNLTSDGYDFVSSTDSVDLCAGGKLGNNGDGDGYDSDPTNPADYDIDTSTGCLQTLTQLGDHGLHVAGTIGAVGNDANGVTGINWTVKIRPVRALGLGGGNTYDGAQGILYAAGLAADNGQGATVTAASGAAIINMSFGGPDSSLVEYNAIVAANAAGSLLIASAGNSATSAPGYPASFPDVVSVSAVGPDTVLASYSSFGPTVDLAAPGGDFADGDASFGVASTMWDYQNNVPTYALAVGTSMAAPHVSGIAALVLAANPGLTNAQLRTRLENYAVDLGAPGLDDQYGHGLVNARNALTQTLAPTRSIKVFLIDTTTGATIMSVAADAGGAYQFTDVPNGTYRVYAGEDEDGDGLFGRAVRRWGAYGGTNTPTPVHIAGAGTTTADFTIGYPLEAESNDVLATANPLPVGGYLIGFFSDPATDVDVARVEIPATGQYTFETSPLNGACGFALNEDTILDLLSSGGSVLATDDDIDTAAQNLCSRITTNLTAGVYYLRVSAYTGTGASGILGRGYAVSVRQGP
jgi:serine protease